MEVPSVRAFQHTILRWYRMHGRHALPWRKTRNPYHILVSEIMLQQTQVDRVIPKYKSFLKKFPNTAQLARASTAAVIKEWKGLGYNRRALFLRRAAEKILTDFSGTFPRAVSDIESLPGVGPYTARAVSAFAFNAPEVFIETNIRRIFIHFFFRGARAVSDTDILPLVEKALWRKDPRVWYSALMDYGSNEFKKIKNPNRKSRHYARQSKFEGSTRHARSEILQYITRRPRRTKEIASYIASHKSLHAFGTPEKITDILSRLTREGFLEQKNKRHMLAK